MSDEQQLLWEFIYDLLSEADAEAVRQRITADPAFARDYARVKLQTDLVSRAALINDQRIHWYDQWPPTSAPASGSAAGRPVRRWLDRIANWTVAVAATALIGLLGAAWWVDGPAAPRGDVAVAHPTPAAARVAAGPGPLQVRAVLTGPSKLHAEADNAFTVRTRSLGGTPVATQVRYRLYNDAGEVALERAEQTSASGFVRFEVPSTLTRSASRLEVTTDDAVTVPLSRPLEVAESDFVTYLRTDRPVYRPGDSVLYRSVTLSRFGLRADQEVDVHLQVTNSSAEPLPGAEAMVRTEQGVASGEFQLPEQLEPGGYTLAVTSPQQQFPTEVSRFTVDRLDTPRLKKQLEWSQDSFALGEEVAADITIERATGEALPDAPLEIQATLDGEPLAVPPGKTDAAGNYQLRFRLPDSAAQGQATLSVTVADEQQGARETLQRDIPINLGKVNVDLFPEGGELVAGLPNRVYFFGRNPRGEPAHVNGRVISGDGAVVTTIQTEHEGRGVFTLQPEPGLTYRLRIDSPSVPHEVPLPPVSPDRFATIDASPGVYAAGQPVSLRLYAREPLVPLVVAAYCRGAMVGQWDIEPADFSTADGMGTIEGNLVLSEEAQGVIRLTVFDRRANPPTPIVERLVFRRIERELQVAIDAPRDRYAPGEQVELQLQVNDETGLPTPAVLGVSIVDDAALSLAKDKTARMPTYFHLLTEVENPQDLEDANFFLSDEPGAAAALDLLLGTQGWRRFVQAPRSELAAADTAGGRMGDAAVAAGVDALFAANATEWDAVPRRQLAWADEDVVPLVEDNALQLALIPQLAQQAEPLEEAPQTRRTAPAAAVRDSAAWRWIVLGGCGGLLLLVAGFSLGRVGNSKLRMGGAVVAVAGMVYGVMSLSPNVSFTKEAAVGAAPGQVAMKLGASKSMPMAADVAPDNAAASEGVAGDVESFAIPAPAAEANMRLAESALDAPSAPLESAATVEREVAPPLPAPAAPEKAMAPAARHALPADPALQGREALAPRGAAIAEARAGTVVRPEQALVEQRFRQYASVAPLAAEAVTQPSLSPTLLWRPRVNTDAQGASPIQVPLPPAATSYRAIVEAHGSGRLGAAERVLLVTPSSAAAVPAAPAGDERMP